MLFNHLRRTIWQANTNTVYNYRRRLEARIRILKTTLLNYKFTANPPRAYLRIEQQIAMLEEQLTNLTKLSYA